MQIIGHYNLWKQESSPFPKNENKNWFDFTLCSHLTQHCRMGDKLSHLSIDIAVILDLQQRYNTEIVNGSRHQSYLSSLDIHSKLTYTCGEHHFCIVGCFRVRFNNNICIYSVWDCVQSRLTLLICGFCIHINTGPPDSCWTKFSPTWYLQRWPELCSNYLQRLFWGP